MINNVKLNGFKSYVEKELRLCPLTILTGLNSSGKSTIIQALRILNRFSKNEKNPLLDGYGSERVLRNPNVPSWSISAECDNGNIITFGEKDEDRCYASDFPNVLYVSAGRLGPQVSLHLHKNDELDENGENVLKCIDIHQDDIVPEDVRHPDAEGDTLLYNIRAWIGTISPKVSFDWEIQEETDSSYSLFDNHRANNVGFGLSYSLPIITSLLLAAIQGNTIVLLENPEAHLHPKGQVEMAKLVAKAVRCGVQVIVETHSDHFFDGLRIAIKEKEVLADNVIAYWFEQDLDKNTKEEKCFIDSNGRMLHWPKGMFDQFEIDSLKLM